MPTTEKSYFPSLTLRAAFGTAANVAASSWTDISVYLRNVDITRGRSRETDQFQAGSATFILKNQDRRFDPEYSAGPYFGNLKPGVQVNLRATWSGSTQDLFYGYAETWQQVYPGQDADCYCELQVVDGFGWLAIAELPDSVWDYQVDAFGPVAWYKLGEKFGRVIGDSSGNAHHGTYAAPVINNQPGILPYSGSGQALLFDGIDDVGFVPATVIPAPPYSIAFWAEMPETIPTDGVTAYSPFQQSTGVTSSPDNWVFYLDPSSGQMVFYNDELTGVFFTNPRKSDLPMVAKGRYFVAATYTAAGSAKLYINGLLQTASGSGFGGLSVDVKGQPLIGGWNGRHYKAWPGIIDEVTFWDHELLALTEAAGLYSAGAEAWDGDTSGDRVSRILTAVGWPTSLKDVDTGSSILGPATLGGKALDYLQTVATTEGGLFYMTGAGLVRFVGRANLLSEAEFSTSGATFGDGGGSELPYHDVTVESAAAQQIRNIAKVSRQGGNEQSYEDTTSSAAYGPRTISFSGLLMAADGECYDRAVGLVLRYKDPGFRVSGLTIMPRRNPSVLYPKVLAYELGQKITVARRPQGVGTAISKEVHIEGVRHEINASQMSWVTTWQTAPVDPNEDAWALVGAANVGASDAHVAF